MTIGGYVELMLGRVWLAAGHREHLASARIDRDDRTLRHALPLRRELVLEGLFRQLLLV